MSTTLSTSITIEKVAAKYGLLTFAGLSIYFLLMKFAGLFQITELRALNGVIMITGLWKALNYYKNNSISKLLYLEGLGLGTMTAMIAVIPFAAFIIIYLVIDTEFMAMLKVQEDFGQYLNPYILGSLIAFEGIFSGAIISFGMMQYLKKDTMSV